MLRDRYVRETRKKKQPSGSATRAVPPWELQQSMSVLNDFVKYRKLVSGAIINSRLFAGSMADINNYYFSNLTYYRITQIYIVRYAQAGTM